MVDPFAPIRGVQTPSFVFAAILDKEFEVVVTIGIPGPRKAINAVLNEVDIFDVTKNGKGITV